jgi:hypothetical protein
MRTGAAAIILLLLIAAGCDQEGAAKQFYRSEMKKVFRGFSQQMLFEAFTSVGSIHDKRPKAERDKSAKEQEDRLASLLENTTDKLKKIYPPESFRADHQIVVDFFDKGAAKIRDEKAARFSEAEKDVVEKALKRMGLVEKDDGRPMFPGL